MLSIKSIINKKINIGAKSAIVYTIATLFSRGLAIITVPIFTRIMTTDQIGVVNLYNSWYALISAFATLSLTSGGYVVAMKEFEGRRDQYQSSVLSLTSIIALGTAGVYFIAPSFWSELLGLPNELIVLMLIGFLFAPARDFWLARQRYEHKYKLAGGIMIGSALLASALAIGTVLYCNKNNPDAVVNGRLFSNYFVIYGVAAVIWIYTITKGRTFYNKDFWKLSLSLSIPLVGYSIAAQVLGVSDRMMISRMVDNSAVGIYSTLYTVSSISIMVWQAIHSSFVPYLFQNIEKKKSGIKRISFVLILTYSVIAILMAFIAPEIVRVLATEEYYESIYIMPPIAAGVFLSSYSNIYSDIAVYYKQTKYVMYAASIAAVSNVILNLVFIKLFGYMAAAYTTMFSYIILAFCQAIWARKLCKEHGVEKGTIYDDKKLFILAVFTMLVTLCGLFLYNNTILRYSVIAVSTVIAVVVVVKLYRAGTFIKH